MKKLTALILGLSAFVIVGARTARADTLEVCTVSEVAWNDDTANSCSSPYNICPTPNRFLHIYPGGSMGAYWSTAPDLLRFYRALLGGRLLRPATLALMRAPRPELGSPSYGFGVMLDRAPGAWGHAGDLPGADADFEVHGDTLFIVLANYDSVNGPVLQMIRALFGERRPA